MPGSSGVSASARTERSRRRRGRPRRLPAGARVIAHEGRRSASPRGSRSSGRRAPPRRRAPGPPRGPARSSRAGFQGDADRLEGGIPRSWATTLWKPSALSTKRPEDEKMEICYYQQSRDTWKKVNIGVRAAWNQLGRHDDSVRAEPPRSATRAGRGLRDELAGLRRLPDGPKLAGLRARRLRDRSVRDRLLLLHLFSSDAIRVRSRRGLVCYGEHLCHEPGAPL